MNKKNDKISTAALRKKTGKMKEEISLELEEIGNLNPKYEPMTPNDRQKSESERTYK
ncbi:hypothetical protein [Sporosarcina sp. YIM B06819]|uniref:hypothetical protein n=1 Tax=Sporosarcina sp. YIM B06819 TaxID=3081769 RepID=UPI00298BDDDC|nr:hypothetical protein [Sporosarcina sp. YIM B06819]